MNLKKFVALSIAAVFTCAITFAAALPVSAGPSGSPPGQEKKSNSKVETGQMEQGQQETVDQEDTDEGTEEESTTQNDSKHPGAKGLQNAYGNVKENGASERAREVLKQKLGTGSETAEKETAAPTTASLVYSDGDISFITEQDGNSLYVAPAGAVTFSYELQDENGEPVQVSGATVNWTVENKGNESVTFSIGDKEITLDATNMTTITRDIQAGSSCTLTVDAPPAADLQITAGLEGEDGFTQSAGIIFYPPENKLASDSGKKLDWTTVIVVENSGIYKGSNNGISADVLLKSEEGTLYYAPSTLVFESIGACNISEGDQIAKGDAFKPEIDSIKEGGDSDYDYVLWLKSSQ